MKMTLKEINQKIRDYPKPIAGNDSYFNWLLEEKGKLQTLIKRNRMKTRQKPLYIDDSHQCHYG